MKAPILYILAFFSLFAWLLPIVGFPVTIIGMVGSIKNIAQHKTDAASVITLAICSIALVLTMLNSAIGALIGWSYQP
jgi:hypothetical protein